VKNWYIIECSRGKEEQCAEHLRGRFEFEEVWFPVKRIDTRRNPRSNTTRHKKVLWITGYLFVCAEDFQPHLINGWRGQLWFKVMMQGENVVTIPEDKFTEMRDLPDRLKQYVEDEAARIVREAEARKPVVGEMCKLVDGPLRGQEGICKEFKFERPLIDLGVLGKYLAEAGEAERKQ
jgi:transcription antitermination factor NusG